MTEYPNVLLRKSGLRGKKVTLFEVAEDCQLEYNAHHIVIPEGYCTDFASVPRWLWSIIPPHGRMAIPSIVHDFVYDNRLLEKEMGSGSARLYADITFLWHCRIHGVPTFQATAFFLAVRIFGKKWWLK